MYFYLIGIDYKSASISVREEIYRRRNAISGFWTALNPQGSAMLATCNRLEIYGTAEYADDAFGHISRFAERFPGFAKYAYIKYGEAETFRHALRLAAGLESQIKGERQILAQLKRWRQAIPARAINDLWGKTISLSQKIRAASKIDEDSPDIAGIVFDDIRERLEPEKRYEIIIIGTGNIAELLARHKPHEAYLSFAAHKNYEKAENLASYSNGEVIYLADLPRAIARTDILICATSSPHYVIKKDNFSKWMASRKNPLYIYDLAIPRDVEPEIGAIDGVSLHNLDDLGRLFDRHNGLRQERIELASGLIGDVLGVLREVAYDKHY